MHELPIVQCKKMKNEFNLILNFECFRMYQEFLTQPKRYRMYWARNYIGWPEFSAFQPNETHKTFANWERKW